MLEWALMLRKVEEFGVSRLRCWHRKAADGEVKRWEFCERGSDDKACLPNDHASSFTPHFTLPSHLNLDASLHADCSAIVSCILSLWVSNRRAR